MFKGFTKISNEFIDWTDLPSCYFLRYEESIFVKNFDFYFLIVLYVSKRSRKRFDNLWNDFCFWKKFCVICRSKTAFIMEKKLLAGASWCKLLSIIMFWWKSHLRTLFGCLFNFCYLHASKSIYSIIRKFHVPKYMLQLWQL